jgi:peptidoglycan/xylan/chitin deacetylase (PgdA/CDA1 family)
VSARARLGRALDRAGVLDRVFWLRARLGRRGLTALTYHRIGCVEQAGELDPGVFEATPEQLADELAVIARHATAVSLADVRRWIRGGRLPPNAVLVTFDDGYADAVTQAVPILRRAGVPATFFIATAFPDAGRLFWWDRVWLLCRRSRRERVELSYPSRLVVHPLHAPAAAAGAICGAVKRARRIDMGRLGESLERDLGVALDAAEERALAGRTLLSWSGVRRLRAAGMDVQSHSHEHVIMNSLAPEAAERDLGRSARVLGEVLGEVPYAVAYPVGYELPGALRGATRRAGFEIGFTNGTGVAGPVVLDPLAVPRVSTTLGMGPLAYKIQLLLGDRRTPRPPWRPAEDGAEDSAEAGTENGAAHPGEAGEPASVRASGA